MALARPFSLGDDAITGGKSDAIPAGRRKMRRED